MNLVSVWKKDKENVRAVSQNSTLAMDLVGVGISKPVCMNKNEGI